MSSYYYPMIAKVIVYDTTRHKAGKHLKRWLDNSYVGPAASNKGFLYECLDLPAFAKDDLDTGVIEPESEMPDRDNPPSELVRTTAGRRYRRNRLNGTLGDVQRIDGFCGFHLNRAPERQITLHGSHGAMSVLADSDDTSTGLCSDFEQDTVIVTERGHTHFFTTRPTTAADAGTLPYDSGGQRARQRQRSKEG